MFRATYNRILHSKGRLLLTVIAVALGVAFLSGSFVLRDSTSAVLHDAYAQVYAGTDLVVRGPERLNAGPVGAGATAVPADIIEDIEAVPGVARAEGRLRGPAQLARADGEQVAAVAMAVPSDPAAAAIDVRAGRLPHDGSELAVDAAAARELDLEPGADVQVLLAGGPVDAEVVGVVGFGDLDSLAGGVRVLLDGTTAAALIGDGTYAEIAVQVAVGTPASQLREELSARLGDAARVQTATEAAAGDAAVAARAAGSVSQIVTGVALVALLVGAFLIANTFRMLVGQRIRELALLRAIGASRRQVGASVLLEAGGTGLAGSLVGVAAGIGVGVLLVDASGALLPGLPTASPKVAVSTLFVGPVVGVGVTLLAGLGAARRALAVPPVAAMRSAAVGDVAPSRRRLWWGLLTLAVGAALITAGAASEEPLLLAAGAVVGSAALALLFPFLTGPVLSLLSRPVARFGIAGRLARQQALTSPKRTGATAGALAVSLALVVFLLVVAASLSAAVPALVTARQHAELVIRPVAQQGLHDFLFDAAAAVDELPEVAAARVVTYGELQLAGSGGNAAFYSLDPAQAAALFDVQPARGRVADVGRGEVAVRDDVAAARGWDLGEGITVGFGAGERETVTLAATFTGAITTDWILAPETVEPHISAGDREAFVKLVEGATVEQVRPAVEQALEPYRAARLLDRGEQQEEIASANNSTLGILTALLSLSVLVGVLGVVNTLTLAVVERVRELGLLRAVGATRRQVRAMIRWEAVLTALLGGAAGALLGLGLAWMATRALGDELPLPYTVPGLAVAAAIAATALLAVLAAALPAVRAARVDVLRALSGS